jgi:hypothetical protein
MVLPYRKKRGFLLPLLFSASFSLAAPAGARITFSEESAVLFSSMVVQDVIPAPGGYRMYLSSDGVRILSATSPDQVTWTIEAGVRLSTSPAAGIDSSSITACGVMLSTNPADGYRMFYVGVSSVGYYSILSATSSDGLVWNKEPGIRLQNHDGPGFLDSPRPFTLGPSGMRLFYVSDSAGTNNPSNYRIASASSTDGGVSLDAEGQTLADPAYQVSVTTLTDGRTRIYYSAPLAPGTTSCQVLSAISSNGLTFEKEDGVRLSTSPALASLTHPVVVRSTESFRWRMYSTYTPGGSTIAYTSHALTLTPLVLTMSPSVMFKSASDVPFVLTGEIFSPSPAITFTIGSDTLTATGVAAPSDLRLTGILSPNGKAMGYWDAVVTNPDGDGGTLVKALLLDVPEGVVSILDNLFRPLKGGTAKITTQFFTGGRVVIKLFTVDGGLVTTLLDQDLPEGTYITPWDGRSAAGNVVASGVYLLSVQGPKIKTVEKIVVIK